MMGTSSHFGWFHFSRFHGLNESSVELVDLPVSAMSEAMLNGRIDAAVVWDPWDVELARATGTTTDRIPARCNLHGQLAAARRSPARHEPTGTAGTRVAMVTRLPLPGWIPDQTNTFAGWPACSTRMSTVFSRARTACCGGWGMNWSVLVSLGGPVRLADSAASVRPPAGTIAIRLLAGRAVAQAVASALVTVPPYLMVAETTSDTAP